MNKPTGFHVRHDLQPHLTHELLTLLRACNSTQSREQLKNAAQERGYELRTRKSYDKLLRSLFELGILSDYRSSIELSAMGRIIADTTSYYPRLLPELVHFLYYTSWDQNHNNRFSWSYKTVCNALWNSSPSIIDRDRLVNLVTQEALREFDIDGVSFSTSSVAGIINWLIELQPPCVVWNKKLRIFTRRSYCSVELLALALNHVYQQEKPGAGHYVVLSPEVRENICQICLIVPEAFDEVLTHTESFFDSLHVRCERGERFAMLDFSWDMIRE